MILFAITLCCGSNIGHKPDPENTIIIWNWVKTINRACLCHSNLIVKFGILLVCFLYNPQFFNKFFVRESWWFWWFPFPTTQYLPNHCVQLLIHLRVVTAFASAFVHISEQSQSSFSFLSNLSSNQVNTEFEQILADIHFHFMLDFWIRFIQTWTPIFF